MVNNILYIYYCKLFVYVDNCFVYIVALEITQSSKNNIKQHANILVRQLLSKMDSVQHGAY